MKDILLIDRRSGLITTIAGTVVFDPAVGPKAADVPRPMSVKQIFEGPAQDGTKVFIFLREILGDLILELSAIIQDSERVGMIGRKRRSWRGWRGSRDFSRGLEHPLEHTHGER